MTRFQDGPAKGQVLMLKRAAIFIRVTEADGKFDALDQPEDQPYPGEKLYAYTLVSRPIFAFIDGPKYRGRYVIAEYRYCDPQPVDDIMRSNLHWDHWCHHQGPREDLQ